MIETLKTSIVNQYDAALCMLNACVSRCPEAAWSTKIDNWMFGQVVFHALFFTDLYLGLDQTAMKQQPFHLQHRDTFGGYEELEDHPPTELHSRDFISSYLQHCREKVHKAVAAESEASLKSESRFPWLSVSRLQLHLCSIRHIQHHAAHCGLRLSINGSQSIAWVKTGWRER